MTTHYCCLLLLKHKEDKTHKKTTKKNQEKGGNLPSNSCSAISLLVPASTLLSQTFSLGIFFSNKRKKQKPRKKKKCREGRELSFKLPFCPLTFGSCLCLPTSTLLFQTLSLGIFFFSTRRKEKQTKKKKTIEKKKMHRKEGAFL